MTTSAWVLAQPGVLRQVDLCGRRLRVAECARCGLARPLPCRGLCIPCYNVVAYRGEAAEWGWTKTERIAVYAKTRHSYKQDGGHPTVAEAAAAAGVSERTGQRYEDELARAGLAPWRATDINVVYASRRGHRRLGGC